MRTNLSLLSILLVSNVAFAGHLSPEQALRRMETHSIRKTVSLSADFSSMRLDATVGNLYVFTPGDGFVVLPADDRAPAILGYADEGRFDPAGNPELAYWMDFYNSQLESLDSRTDGEASADAPAFTRPSRSDIEPLIKTKWNQEAPFNEMCPRVDGHETVTGCVATAMAQAMKFFNYPERGVGSHSYFWRPGEEELTFDYAETPFQWDRMTDTYDSRSTPEARHAVAELMLGCGVSVDMHYEPGGSGAATMAMGSALIDIFGYSRALWMPNRAFYGLDEWEEMIYSELSAGRPVLYSGAGTDGGHQFICDGYKGDGFFHFNWGWGGLSDGYFLLNALNPDDLGVGGGAGGFNTSQVATLGMQPAVGEAQPVYLFYNTIGFTTDVKTVKADEDFRCGGEYFNYSLFTMPEGSRLGMKFEKEGETEVRYAEGPGVDGYHPYDGRYDLQVRFPELPDGTYRITPALKVDGKWFDVRMPVGYACYVTAVVTDRTAVISDSRAAEIEVTDITLPSSVYRDKEFHMEFKVANHSDLEYYGSVTPMLLDVDGKERASSKFRPVDVMAGSEENVGDYIGSFKALKDTDFPAGDYQLVFKDEQGRWVSTPLDVKVEVEGEDPSQIILIESDAAPDGTVYDLGGRRRSLPLPPGIYIINGEKRLIP